MNRWENVGSSPTKTDLRRVRTFFHMILLRKRVPLPAKPAACFCP